MTDTPRDPWHKLRAKTPARIAIGRAGAALPTREVLAFAMSHARARDAVYAHFDREQLAERLAEIDFQSVSVDSQATSRDVYLRRPDLGRRLAPASRQQIQAIAKGSQPGLTLVVADGLSAAAVQAGAFDLIAAFKPHIGTLGIDVGQIILAREARVALGDEIGELTGASLVAVIIGERPGLSAADNLSVYLTYNPTVGRNDAQRNCISNIGHGRFSPDLAAANLAWLIDAARQRQLTGVALKDESPSALALTSQS